jgi:hypothetical protein
MVPFQERVPEGPAQGRVLELIQGLEQGRNPVA